MLLGRRSERPRRGPARVFQAAALLFLLFAPLASPSPLGPRPAFADGSRGLYPANAACTPNSTGGSCRANIEWRTSFYGPVGGTQVRRRALFQVFANAGEVLDMGSSAVGVGSGDILVYNPGVITDSNAEPLPAITPGVNGFTCSAQRAGSGIAAQGQITSRAQEQLGPDTVPSGGVPGAYTPCTYVAPRTGLYGAVFYGPAGNGQDTDGGSTGDITLASATNFDATQRTSVAAWDLSVRSSVTSTTDTQGRLFTYALVAFTAGNGRPVNSTVYIVTADGYQYRTDTRGLDPNGFALYANQVGFFDSDGATPLDHDAFGTTNSGMLTALAGGVNFAAPAYPIFFTPPDPATLVALGIPLAPVAPIESAFSFTGNYSGSTSTVGSGGTFRFTSNTGGVYEIIISRDGTNFDPGGTQNRVLRGVRPAGT